MNEDPGNERSESSDNETLTGLFEDPFWYRCLVAPLVLIPGCVILGFCFQVDKDGSFIQVLISFLTVEPLGAFLVLTGITLISPSSFGKWYLKSRNRAFKLMVLWIILVGIALIVAAILVNLQ